LSIHITFPVNNPHETGINTTICHKLNSVTFSLVQTIQSIARKVFDFFDSLFSEPVSSVLSDLYLPEDVTEVSEESQTFEISTTVESEEESVSSYPGIPGVFTHTSGDWEEDWAPQWASNFIRFRSRTANSYIRSVSLQIGPESRYSLTMIFNFMDLLPVPRSQEGQTCADFLMERGVHQFSYPEAINLKFTGLITFDQPADILIALDILEKDNDFPEEDLAKIRDIAENDRIPPEYLKRRKEREFYPRHLRF